MTTARDYILLYMSDVYDGDMEGAVEATDSLIEYLDSRGFEINRKHRLKAGDIVDATFKPRNTDDLTPAAQRIVGERFTWTVTRRVEDNGMYDGMWRLELGEADFTRTNVWWVAECDIADVVHIGVDQDAAALYALTTKTGAKT